MSDQCFICGVANSHVLQEHHIVPKRHGGTDRDENLVTLCASCHQAIEKIYDERFYTRLSINQGTGVPEKDIREVMELVEERAQEAKDGYSEKFHEFPAEEGTRFQVAEETRTNLGFGESAGFRMGVATMSHIFLTILENRLPSEEKVED